IGSVIVMAVRPFLAVVSVGSLRRTFAVSRNSGTVSGSKPRTGAGVEPQRGHSGRGPERLPARLGHAGELAPVGHLAQADAAQAELAVDRLRPAAALAAGVAAHRELRLAGRLDLERCLRHRLTAP